MRFISILLFMAPLAAYPAVAADFVEVHGDWSVFANKKNKATQCHIGSEPTKETGDYSQRGDAYVLVAHDREAKTTSVVSFTQGYTLKKDSDVEVEIGGQTFKLFAADDTAWARDQETDVALVAAMRGGVEMVVTAYSARGTKTIDTYSLAGVSAAHSAINALCGIK